MASIEMMTSKSQESNKPLLASNESGDYHTTKPSSSTPELEHKYNPEKVLTVSYGACIIISTKVFTSVLGLLQF